MAPSTRDSIAIVGIGCRFPGGADTPERFWTLVRDGVDIAVRQGTGLPPDATAGVLTSRAAAQAFFVAGTNRAMFRFTLMNHLCNDLEQLNDTTRAPDRIRQDVSRSPGGDSRIFLNSCVGCHSPWRR